MVFNIKMEDSRQKARLAAGDHMTKAPATITYASVMSRETIRIGFMIATLLRLSLVKFLCIVTCHREAVD